MSIPINLNKIADLVEMGVNPASITFSSTTMESGQTVLIRDTQQGVLQIVGVNDKNITTKKLAAEGAIMNPKYNVIAVHSADRIQVINLEMKSVLRDSKTEPVQFFRWLNTKTIGMVCNENIYHFNIDQAAPKKIFKKRDECMNATPIYYDSSKDEKWCLMCGVKKDEETQMPVGVINFYSVDQQVDQVIPGYGGCFCDYEGKTFVVLFTQKNSSLFIMNCANSKDKKTINLPMQPNDFPFSFNYDEKHGIFYILSKMGYLFMVEIKTGMMFFQRKVLVNPPCNTAFDAESNNFYVLSRKGELFEISLQKQQFISYLKQNNMIDVALSVAARSSDLDGGSDLHMEGFRNLIGSQRIDEAIDLVLQSESLRTTKIITELQNIFHPATQKPAISQYFKVMSDRQMKMNKDETLILARTLLQKGNVAPLKQLYDSNMLEASETLGDMVGQFDSQFALTIYYAAKAHDKIVSILGQTDPQKVIAYCQKTGYKANYLNIFKQILASAQDPGTKAADFAAAVYNLSRENIDPIAVVDIFIQGSFFKHATSFCFNVMKNDDATQGNLQTKLLEMNLLYSPLKVVTSILSQDMYSHYDKPKIAQMLEKAGLYSFAMKNYTEYNDIKNICVNFCTFMEVKDIIGKFQTMNADQITDVLSEMLKKNPMQNLSLVVQIATQFSALSNTNQTTRLNIPNVVALFEKCSSQEGIFFYLSSLINAVTDPDLIYKYIVAAVMTGNHAEAERITRESDDYDPEKVKNFFKKLPVQDLQPLLITCLFNVHEKTKEIEGLVAFLYQHQLLKYIDIYVKQKNPQNTPKVVGALLDVDASEDFIKGIIMAIGSMCPVEPLVAEVEKRNRLKLLLPWLEARLSEGSKDPALHNAIAKIYIDIGKEPENFLKLNNFYNPKVVGEYCEKRNPHLAFICYEKGECDELLVELTNKNAMFKQQARYLVRRKKAELWDLVLNPNNKFRRQIIDQVVQTALPASNSSDEVSVAVKSFMKNDLPNELIELLEQIVGQGAPEFKENKNLQNLLILTAIRSDQSKVMDYITKLDKYDGEDIAKVAIEKKLYKEAFTIYNKLKNHSQAISVLISHMGELEKAVRYAEEISSPEVWKKLGSAQLVGKMVPEAIDSFMKAGDATQYHEIIAAAEECEKYNELVPFLKMARTTGKQQDPHIDTELIYSLAKISAQNPQSSALADLDEFISSPNVARIQVVGDRCFEEGLYEPARILFASIPNYSRLASALIKLGKCREAVTAATKANAIKTWKEVMAACVDAGDFKYAQACALNIIIHADEMDDLVYFYESRSHHDQLIELLEKAAATPDNAHMGIFTTLGCLYAKYRPEKMMDHIVKNYKRSNIQKLLQACEENELFAEERALYMYADEFDEAVVVMIQHPVEAWDHNVFSTAIKRVSNAELLYKSMHFYLQQAPQFLNDLLVGVAEKLDASRVAKEITEAGFIPLIKNYLEAIQNVDSLDVNEALNSLYIEEEDYEALKMSIEKYKNINGAQLAKNLSNHELLEFRKVASLIFKQMKKWKESIDLCLRDKLWEEAIQSAADSQDPKLAKDLIDFWIKDTEKFTAQFGSTLFVCYHLLEPDYVLEKAWRNKLIDIAMPYFIQAIAEYKEKVDTLREKDRIRDEQEKQAKEAKDIMMSQSGMGQFVGGSQFPAFY